MTNQENDFVWLIVQPGHYLVLTSNYRGRTVYKMMCGNQVPVQIFSVTVVSKFINLLKHDHKDRWTANLNKVRQLHGKKKLKVLYKKQKLKTNDYKH